MRQTWRLVGYASVLAALFALAPGDLLAQKKNKKAPVKDPGYPATEADYSAIKKNKTLTGKILEMDSANKTVTLRVDTSHYEPNPNYKPPVPPKNANKQTQALFNLQNQINRTSQDLMNQQQRLASATNPRAYQQAMAKIQADMNKLQQEQMQLNLRMSQAAAAGQLPVNNNPNNQPYKTVTTSKDYTLEVQEAIPVRKLYLGTEYDDEGNIKKYTEKDKDELRGKDKKKPGYEAKFEDVSIGQEVHLYLTPPKTKSKSSEAKPKDPKSDDEKVETPPEPPEHSTVNMIVMIKEMPPISSAAPANPKKNKK